MITLNIKESTRQTIKAKGRSIQIRDNKNNYFGSNLQIFFSKNSDSKLAVVNYDLPIGAGDAVISLHVLDDNKNTVYRSRNVNYVNQDLDEYLLS